MKILAIETSCDETAVAVVSDGRLVLSSELFSQADMHALYGGVVPEIASRNHIAVISKLTELALKNASLTTGDIDAIAVTYAPGLIGALLVGVNFAKGLSLSLDIPLIPVHHIRGHIASGYIAFPEFEPPFICAVVSGGNTLIAEVTDYTKISIVGQTRDDAAGECFDKVARVLGLGYPGGAALDKLAAEYSGKLFDFTRPVIEGAPFDMSFSGLKTSVINLIHNAKQSGTELNNAKIAASLVAAVSDILIPRIISAAKQRNLSAIALTGGVAANSFIRAALTKAADDNNFSLYIPPLSLCGDNAAMIGSQAYYEYSAGFCADMTLDAVASLSADICYNSAT